MDRNEIENFALNAGAHACGIASIDSFIQAPEGFKPTDIFSECKSVVVCIKQMPTGNMSAENPIPYTHAAYKMYEEMDRISMELCRFFQSKGVKAAIIPSDVPYIYWDEEKKHGRGIISLKHAAVLAGLGIMGKSTIFINKQFGNIVYIGAVLIDKKIEPTPMSENFDCPPNCNRCLDACPVQAISNGTVNQKLCREHSFIKVGRGWDLYKCSECRKVCIYHLGSSKFTNSEKNKNNEVDL